MEVETQTQTLPAFDNPPFSYSLPTSVPVTFAALKCLALADSAVVVEEYWWQAIEPQHDFVFFITMDLWQNVGTVSARMLLRCWSTIYVYCSSSSVALEKMLYARPSGGFTPSATVKGISARKGLVILSPSEPLRKIETYSPSCRDRGL
ncbi:hypothetical protein ACFX2I_037431 [Malus domestica]